MWLQRLVVVLAELVHIVAPLLWKEPLVRHSLRICLACAVKSAANWVVVQFEMGKSTQNIFVGLLDLSLYAFCLDIMMELLKDLGIPIRELLQDLYRYLVQRSKGDGRKLGARAGGRGEADETGEEASRRGSISQETRGLQGAPAPAASAAVRPPRLKHHRDTAGAPTDCRKMPAARTR